MQIRTATSLDKDGIHCIYWSAFPEEERGLVADLAVNLLSEKTTPKTISFVAETDGTIVGHVAFSPVTIEDSDRPTYILAPLAVHPDHQKQRIGTQLVETGIQHLTQMGVDTLLVYGDPNYYGRFGFSDATAKPYLPPYELQYPFGWQGLLLGDRKPPTSPVRINCVAALRDPALW